jgi:hypothetical protein
MRVTLATPRATWRTLYIIFMCTCATDLLSRAIVLLLIRTRKVLQAGIDLVASYRFAGWGLGLLVDPIWRDLP